MIFIVLGLLILSAASFADLKKKEVPYWILFSALLEGIVCCFALLSESAGNIFDIAYSMLPGAVLLGLAMLSGGSIGLGDGFLALFMGPVFGAKRMVIGIFAAFFISALFSALILALRKARRDTRIPFVPFITCGMGVMSFVL